MQATAEQLPKHQQHEPLNQELRIRTDTETWLAETLNGNMRTSFEYSFDGRELYGEDGGEITPIFDDAIQESEIIVQQNPSLLFELRRRLIERGELDDMKSMARGELLDDNGNQVNTIVVLSDFPPELMGAKEDVGGYNTNRMQTMMRVITLEESGTIRVTTQSLDRSNRQGLEDVYGALGQVPTKGELLEQRVNLSLPPEWQDNLINNLTKVYDQSLAEQYGGKWHAGRRPADHVNTYDFVRSQEDLIDWFTAEKLNNPAIAEKRRYDLAATMKARFERFLGRPARVKKDPILGEVKYETLVSVDSIVGGQSLAMELQREGQRAASAGEVFSGCGASIKAQQTEAENELEQSGYGNKTKSRFDDDCEFVSKKCPECHARNVKTKVTKTHISGSCGCSKKR